MKKLTSQALILLLVIIIFLPLAENTSAQSMEDPPSATSPVSLTVLQTPVSLLTSPVRVSLAENETQDITVTAVYEDASSEDISDSSYLSLSVVDRTVATLSGNTITAVSIGSTTLNVSYGGLDQEVPITVQTAFDNTNFTINYTNPGTNGNTVYYEEDGRSDSFGIHYTLPTFNGNSSTSIDYEICDSALLASCFSIATDSNIYGSYGDGDEVVKYFTKGEIYTALTRLGLSDGSTGYVRIRAGTAENSTSSTNYAYFVFKSGSISTDTTTGFQNNITISDNDPVNNLSSVNYKTGSSTVSFTNTVHIPEAPREVSIRQMTLSQLICTDVAFTNCTTLQIIRDPQLVYGYNTDFDWATSKGTLATAGDFMETAGVTKFYIRVNSSINYSDRTSSSSYGPNFTEYESVSENQFSNEDDFTINYQSEENESSIRYTTPDTRGATLFVLGTLFADYAGSETVTLTEEACTSESFSTCTTIRTYSDVYTSYPSGIYVYNTGGEIDSAASSLGISSRTPYNLYIHFTLQEDGRDGEGPLTTTNYFNAYFYPVTSSSGSTEERTSSGGGSTDSRSSTTTTTDRTSDTTDSRESTSSTTDRSTDTSGDTRTREDSTRTSDTTDSRDESTSGSTDRSGDTSSDTSGRSREASSSSSSGGSSDSTDSSSGDSSSSSSDSSSGSSSSGNGGATHQEEPVISIENIARVATNTIERITKTDLSTDKLIDDFYKVIIPPELSITREEFTQNMVEELKIKEVYREEIKECDQNLQSCFSILESKLKKKIDPATVFPDIKDSPYKDDIITLAKLGFISGTDEGLFQPDRYINRIEALKIITGPSGLIENKTYDESVALLGGEKGIFAQTTAFDDVNAAIKEDASIWWYPNYLKVACEIGIINCNQNIFQPHAIITPVEVTTLIDKIKRVLEENQTLILRNSDDDSDGLIFYKELIYGTDPKKADTDDDGLNDFEEIYKTGTNPKSADSDNDQLTDKEEKTLGTNPNQQDTDEDGASDWFEVKVSKTDPNDRNDRPVDVNNNGIADSWEISWGIYNDKSADDTTISINDLDSDKDGLSDLDEYLNGTDPTKADTDADGLNDALEVIQLKTDAKKYTILDEIEPKITNLTNNSLVGDKTPFLLGFGKANKKIEVTVKNDFGHEWTIGTTPADEQGFFEFEFPEEKSLNDGEYLIAIKVLDETNKTVISSSPIKVTIQNNLISKPEPLKLGNTSLTEDHIRGGRRILLQTNYPKFTGQIATNARAVAHWKSIIRSSSMVTTSKEGEFSIYPPEPLEAGDHELIVYSVRKSDGAISDTIRVKFFVGENATSGADGEIFDNDQALLLKNSAPNSKGGGFATIKNFFYRQKDRPLLSIFLVTLIAILTIGTISYRRFIFKNSKSKK